MSPRVMIVDDEEDLVWTMVRQIPRHRPGVVAEGFCDPLEAVARLRLEPPDLLVTDLRMPGMGGIDLLIAARQVAPRLPVVVMTAFSTSHARREIMKQGGVQFLEKPFELQKILDTIDHGLGSREGFQGAILLPMLPDLVQLYAMARVTGALRITNGDRIGILWFDSGEIVHAECKGKEGSEAFFEMLRWQGGHFEMDSVARSQNRTIDSRWEGLLLEGCRLMDEALARQPVADKPEVPDGTEVPDETAAASVLAMPALHDELDLQAVRAAVAVSLPGAWPAEPAPSHPQDWSEALDALARAAGALSTSGNSGVVELVSPAAGFALFFTRGAERVGFGLDLSGREALVRFRAGVGTAFRAGRPGESVS